MANPSAQMRIIQKKIERAVFQAQKIAARQLVQVLIDAIRTRVRLLKELADGAPIPGFPNSVVTKNGKKITLPYSLYVKQRERYSSRLDADTAPDVSNATATGQMLNSMKGKANGTKITIDLKTGRRKELSGAKSSLTNSQVNKYYEEKKGEWFNISDTERAEAIDYASKIIKEELKKVLK